MIVKAISLYEPWATAIRLGLKQYETRSWPTSYRGPLLICGAKRWSTAQRDFLLRRDVQAALGGALVIPGYGPQRMLLGKAACLVDLVSCRQITRQAWPTRPEALFGDWTPGRYAWQCANVRPIEPFPVTGRQGLFEVEIPDDLLRNAHEINP